MTTLIDILIATLGIAYILGAIEAFKDLGKLRGFIALPIAVGIFYLIGYDVIDIILLSPASSFLALAVMMFLDRPVAIQTRRL
jgi:hypothetical protein